MNFRSVVITARHIVLTEIEGEMALTGVMDTPVDRTSPNVRNDSVSGPTFPSEINIRIQSEMTGLNSCQEIDKVEPFVWGTR
jgi:hypothetical protein